MIVRSHPRTAWRMALPLLWLAACTPLAEDSGFDPLAAAPADLVPAQPLTANLPGLDAAPATGAAADVDADAATRAAAAAAIEDALGGGAVDPVVEAPDAAAEDTPKPEDAIVQGLAQAFELPEPEAAVVEDEPFGLAVPDFERGLSAPLGVQLVSTIPASEPPRAILRFDDGEEVVVTPGTMIPDEGLVVTVIYEDVVEVIQFELDGREAVARRHELLAAYPAARPQPPVWTEDVAPKMQEEAGVTPEGAVEAPPEASP